MNITARTFEFIIVTKSTGIVRDVVTIPADRSFCDDIAALCAKYDRDYNRKHIIFSARVDGTHCVGGKCNQRMIGNTANYRLWRSETDGSFAKFK